MVPISGLAHGLKKLIINVKILPDALTELEKKLQVILTEAVCADITLNLEQVRNHQQCVHVDDKADD